MAPTVHPLLRKVGQRIRLLRADRQISQEDLADRAGLDRSYMSGIERGIRNTSLLKLHAVAQALKVSIRDLLPED